MIQAKRQRMGQLDCVVVDGGPSPEVAVIMCHGYGAPGEDLVSLAGEWIFGLGPEEASAFRFVFPAAANSLAELGMPDGRAWWPINMSQLMELIEADQFDQLHDRQPPGIDEATEQLSETISEIQASISGPETPLVLGGFSQGAMLTMNTSLRGTSAVPQLLCQFSGTMVCQSHWQANLDRLSSTKVIQSHGTIDPILPFSSAETLHEMLQSSGIDATFHSFMGQHTIDQETVELVRTALSEIARSKS